MGTDKAMLMFRGRTLLDHMLALLAQANVSECVVSGERAGYRCVPDQVPNMGPLGALQALASALPDRQLLIVAVDTPLLPISCLFDLHQAELTQRCVHFDAAPLPLRLNTNAAVMAAIKACASHHDPRQRSLVSLLKTLQAIRLPTPPVFDRRHLSGCNTPDEWVHMQNS